MNMKAACLGATVALAVGACSSPANNGGGSGGGSGSGGGTGGVMTGSGGAGVGSGGAGGSGGGQDAGSGGAGGAAADGGTKDAPGDPPASSDGDGGGPGAGLNGFLFNVPCKTPPQNGDCQGTPDGLSKMVTIPFGGDPSVTYNVTLHFCGPVEGRPYTGCTDMQSMYFCTDGTAATSGFNPTYPIYEMKVSAPAHSYYVNNRDLKDDIFKIDYSASVKIQGGASITFSTTSVGSDLYTALLKNHNFTCPGVPGITQPYAGQFFYITTESIAPAP